jgi:N-acetyl-anhydromuramyl-L-alanine amidase AmpD
MRIHDCFLERGNVAAMTEGESVGERIGRSGARYLWDERSAVVDTVVIHYISAVALRPHTPYHLPTILGIFCDYGVSSHYLIERRGRVWRLVPETKKAWHSGASVMPAPDCRTGVNDFSIGIELVATHSSGFTASQYRSLIALCRDIEHRRGPMTYVGHEDVAGEQAVARGLRREPKPDPGPLFDWRRFTGGL